jgi:hypothetical protein
LGCFGLHRLGPATKAKFVSVDPGGPLGAEAHANLKPTAKNTKAIAKRLYDESKKKVMGQLSWLILLASPDWSETI